MAKLWGDAESEEAVKRMSDLGVREIAVKNGPEAVALFGRRKYC